MQPINKSVEYSWDWKVLVAMIDELDTETEALISQWSQSWQEHQATSRNRFPMAYVSSSDNGAKALLFGNGNHSECDFS